MNIKNLFRKQPEFKKDIKRNVTICMNDHNGYTTKYLDDNKNIIGFMTFHPNNIKSADFYYSLFNNKQIIRIIYNREPRKYNGIITSIELIDTNTLRIYYTVLNNYVED